MRFAAILGFVLCLSGVCLFCLLLVLVGNCRPSRILNSSKQQTEQTNTNKQNKQQQQYQQRQHAVSATEHLCIPCVSHLHFPASPSACSLSLALPAKRNRHSKQNKTSKASNQEQQRRQRTLPHPCLFALCCLLSRSFVSLYSHRVSACNSSDRPRKQQRTQSYCKKAHAFCVSCMYVLVRLRLFACVFCFSVPSPFVSVLWSPLSLSLSTLDLEHERQKTNMQLKRHSTTSSMMLLSIFSLLILLPFASCLPFASSFLVYSPHSSAHHAAAAEHAYSHEERAKKTGSARLFPSLILALFVCFLFPESLLLDFPLLLSVLLCSVVRFSSAAA